MGWVDSAVTHVDYGKAEAHTATTNPPSTTGNTFMYPEVDPGTSPEVLARPGGLPHLKGYAGHGLQEYQRLNGIFTLWSIRSMFPFWRYDRDGNQRVPVHIH